MKSFPHTMFLRRLFYGLLLSVLANLWLVGCASSVPPELEAEDREAKKFLTDPENATIYIYRESYSVFFFHGSTLEGMAGFNLLLHFDGQKISALKPKEFLRMVVPPGPHDVVAINAQTRRQARVSLEVEKGKLYFVKLVPFVKLPGNLNPPAVVVVDEKTGRKAVKGGTVVIFEKGPRVVQ